MEPFCNSVSQEVRAASLGYQMRLTREANKLYLGCALFILGLIASAEVMTALIYT